MAIDDDLIRKNPCKNALKDNGEAPKEKHALTVAQQMKMMQFVRESNIYSMYAPLL